MDTRLARSAARIGKQLQDYSGLTRVTEYLRTMDQKNAVFIWIPKTAGTSLFSLLDAPKLKTMHRVKYRFANQGIVTFGHIDYSRLVKHKYVSKKYDESAFKFAFSRNPYDRAVSLYLYLKRGQRISHDETFLSFTRRLKANEYEKIGLYNINNLSQCNPQVRWIENVQMDFLGKYENLDADFKIVLERLGLPQASLPKLNSGNCSPYQNFYCDETRQRVEEAYQEDFQCFGYDS